MYFILLYYIILYYIILYYIILYYIILYYIILYYIIIYYVILYSFISFHFISYHIISYHIISYHIIETTLSGTHTHICICYITVYVEIAILGIVQFLNAAGYKGDDLLSEFFWKDCGSASEFGPKDSISNYRLALLKWGRTRREDTSNSPLYEQDLQLCLSMVNQLKDFRAGRLSRESLVLPPTFYWTFGLLSVFISISFALREAADPNSEFSIVDRCFFSALTLAFLTLFRFAIDMNYPFKGQPWDNTSW